VGEDTLTSPADAEVLTSPDDGEVLTIPDAEFGGIVVSGGAGTPARPGGQGGARVRLGGSRG
jgi:hypothetical protein